MHEQEREILMGMMFEAKAALDRKRWPGQNTHLKALMVARDRLENFSYPQSGEDGEAGDSLREKGNCCVNNNLQTSCKVIQKSVGLTVRICANPTVCSPSDSVRNKITKLLAYIFLSAGLFDIFDFVRVKLYCSIPD